MWILKVIRAKIFDLALEYEQALYGWFTLYIFVILKLFTNSFGLSLLGLIGLNEFSYTNTYLYLSFHRLWLCG